MDEWRSIAVSLSGSQYLNVPNRYQPHHVIVTLLLIAEQQPLGRYDLAENLTLGEGSIRTLLKRLTKGGYVSAEIHHGQKLTRKGQALVETIKKSIPFGLFLDLGNLVLHQYSFANLIRERASKVTDGVLQRDAALVDGGYGQAGATTLIMKDGMLVMPPDGTNILLGNEKESILILDTLRPEEGDVVVVGTATERNLSREVAMAASMTLC